MKKRCTAAVFHPDCGRAPDLIAALLTVGAAFFLSRGLARPLQRFARNWKCPTRR
jgi:hypothetical protein